MFGYSNCAQMKFKRSKKQEDDKRKTGTRQEACRWFLEYQIIGKGEPKLE